MESQTQTGGGKVIKHGILLHCGKRDGVKKLRQPPSRTEKKNDTPLFIPGSVLYLSPRAVYDVTRLGIDRQRTDDRPTGERMNPFEYIFQGYRRDRQDPRRIVGTVERLGGKLKTGFTYFEEPGVIMGVPRGRARRGSRAPVPGGWSERMRPSRTVCGKYFSHL